LEFGSERRTSPARPGRVQPTGRRPPRRRSRRWPDGAARDRRGMRCAPRTTR
jgi:hypothetical protein